MQDYFKGVFAPAREFWARLVPGVVKPQAAKEAAKIADKSEFVVSDFEKFLSKPVKDLYDLQMSDQKTIFDHAKLMVKTTRKSLT